MARSASPPLVGYLLHGARAIADLPACYDALGEHTPTLEPDPPEGCWLDLRGGRRGPSPARRGARILALAAEWGGPAVRLGVAPTPGTAKLAARLGPDPLTLRDRARIAAFLAPIPVAATGVGPESRPARPARIPHARAPPRCRAAGWGLSRQPRPGAGGAGARGGRPPAGPGPPAARPERAARPRLRARRSRGARRPDRAPARPAPREPAPAGTGGDARRGALEQVDGSRDRDHGATPHANGGPRRGAARPAAGPAGRIGQRRRTGGRRRGSRRAGDADGPAPADGHPGELLRRAPGAARPARAGGGRGPTARAGAVGYFQPVEPAHPRRERRYALVEGAVPSEMDGGDVTARRFAPSRPIAIVADPATGEPRRLHWRGRVAWVARVEATWAVDEGWWRGEPEAIRRRYYQPDAHRPPLRRLPRPRLRALVPGGDID